MLLVGLYYEKTRPMRAVAAWWRALTAGLESKGGEKQCALYSWSSGKTILPIPISVIAVW